MKIFSSGWFWLAAWLIALVTSVYIMSHVRRQELDRFQQPAQSEAWEEWRTAAAKEGPVARRVPKSDEPPTLRLLRDHYAVCLIGVVGFESAIFGFLALMVRGVLNSPAPRIDYGDEKPFRPTV